jgi:hypothetical protein
MKFDLQLFGRLFVWFWAIGMIHWCGLWMWKFANKYGGWTHWDYLYLLRTGSEAALTSIGRPFGRGSGRCDHDMERVVLA